MKTALITGGTVRLGAAITARLRAEGWRVIVSSHRADAGADVIADLADPMGAAKLYAAALRLLGGTPPDALVNNAALLRGDDAALAQVNLEAPRKLTMLMAGREAGVGAVVNILDSQATGSGARGEAGDSGDSYLDSKRGLLAFTKTAAATFAATLRVNAVAPGPVLAPVDVHQRAGEMLLDRRPTSDDVAEAVAYLLSAESVTGAIIPVDSGQHLL